MAPNTNKMHNLMGYLPDKVPCNLNFTFMGFSFNLGDKPKVNEKTNASEMYMPDSLLPPMINRPANSTHRLSRMDIQRASTAVKRFIEHRLESDLGLVKHTAPLAFVAGTGVNDELDGSKSKSPISFVVPNKDVPRGLVVKEVDNSSEDRYQLQCEVIQSLAKWKRLMLEHLGCNLGEGIYCESTSIRKGYKGDVTHSCIADQWDFEIRISESDRKVDTLKSFVRILWKIITDAEDYIHTLYPQILLEGHHTANERLPKEITFITSQELHDMYPNLNVHARETAATRKFGAIFIVGMGWPMKDGTSPEEVRSPSYDDWNLNGDIMVKHPLTGYRHELSSMGIRVDKDSLLTQLKHRGMEHELDFEFHKAVINKEVPFSYGGGLGISRILMLLLRTAHIGEVQCGIWHDDHFRQASAAGIDMIPDRFVPTFYKKFNNSDIAKLTENAQARILHKEATEHTLVSIEVRPAEAETDVFLLWEQITSDFNFPGIDWEKTCHITELAFGIKELCMTLVIERNVSLEEIVEGIESLNDVQSVEVLSMTTIPDLFTKQMIKGAKHEAMINRALKEKREKIVVVVDVHPTMDLQPFDEARLRHKISRIAFPGIHWKHSSSHYKSQDGRLVIEMIFDLTVHDIQDDFVASETVVAKIQALEEVEFVYVKSMTVSH